MEFRNFPALPSASAEENQPSITPRIPKQLPKSRIPYFQSRNTSESSSFGMEKEPSAVRAATVTVIGLTRLALTAACPTIRPPTMPIVLPAGPGMRSPGFPQKFKGQFHQKDFRCRSETARPLLASAMERIKLPGRSCG